MNIKEVFEGAENGTLTYEQFEALAKENGAKFTDLSDGKYVSKSKYDSDLKAKDSEIESINSQITNLNDTIATRDTDLADLQKKLEDAGNDATKLAELSEQFAGLQTKYDNDVKEYQKKMVQQSYEFAVKEFANTKKFTSQAAKRDFTQAMINKNLQFEDGKLIGGEDFVNIYSQDNADAFVVDKPKEEPKAEPPKEEPKPTAKVDVPTFVASAQGANTTDSDTGFHFNFTGVREH